MSDLCVCVCVCALFSKKKKCKKKCQNTIANGTITHAIEAYISSKHEKKCFTFIDILNKEHWHISKRNSIIVVDDAASWVYATHIFVFLVVCFSKIHACFNA